MVSEMKHEKKAEFGLFVPALSFTSLGDRQVSTRDPRGDGGRTCRPSDNPLQAEAYARLSQVVRSLGWPGSQSARAADRHLDNLKHSDFEA